LPPTPGTVVVVADSTTTLRTAAEGIEIVSKARSASVLIQMWI
jgi:hypothetical protein